MTTNKTVNTGGGIFERRERNYVQNYVFLVSMYVLTPGQCYASQTFKGTFFHAGKVCFYVFIYKKIVPADMPTVRLTSIYHLVPEN